MPVMPGIVTSDSTMSMSSLWRDRHARASDATRRLNDFEAARLEHARDRLTRRIVVVHDQHSFSGTDLHRFSHPRSTG